MCFLHPSLSSFRLISYLASIQPPNLFVSSHRHVFTFLLLRHCWGLQSGSPYSTTPALCMLPFLLLPLSSFWAARLGSCLSSLHLQIFHGLVLHFCLLKSYGTQCLAYTVGIFFFVYMCVHFFDHESSYRLLSAKLVLDIVL